jgi:PAS domain S-box-containing protein
MAWSYTPYMIPLCLAAVAASSLIYPAWKRREAVGAVAFASFAALAALWCLGYALEMGWQTIDGKLFWVKVQYVAIVFTSPTFLIFCLQYTGSWRWPQSWQLAFLAPPALILIAVWLEPGLGWLYRQVSLDDSGPFLNLALAYGPLFWFVVAYSYSLLLAGSLLLLQMSQKLIAPYRRQTYALVAATTLPWVGNALYISGLNPLPYLDWTPIGFAGTAVLLAWALRRLQLLNIAPIARAVLFDSITDAVLVWNRQGKLLDFNAAAAALFGITAPKALGMTMEALFSGSFQPLRPLGITGSNGQQVAIHDAPDARYFRVVVSPVLDHRDKENGRLYILNDITASEKAGEDLRYQKQLFENLVAIARVVSQTPYLPETMERVLTIAVTLTNAEVGSLFLLDTEGNVEHHILARQNLGGRYDAAHKEEIAAAVLKDGLAGWVLRNKEAALLADAATDARWLQLPDQPYTAHSVLAVPILRQARVLGILTLTHPEPGRFTAQALQLMQGAANQIALALNNAQMYTAQQRLAADFAKARDEAEAANRAKSAFLATMSHELRTPLTSIIGYNELLQELLQNGTPRDDIAGYLQKVDVSAHHLLTLITDILDISTIEAGRLVLDIEPVDLFPLVQEVIQSVEPLMVQNGNRLITNYTASPGMMATDRRRLRQVLLNLLSNAAKFTEQGTVELNVNSDGHSLQFRIADTGIGLTPEQVQQLFRPFAQADTTIRRRYGGTGLGLMISQQISRLMGGEISVESEYGEGSTFTLSLPATSQLIKP